MSFQEDDLDLDNLPNEEPEDGEPLEGEDESGEDDPPRKGGNLTKALQAERRAARELREQLEAERRQRMHAETLLQTVGQHQRQPQMTPEEYNQRLQEDLLERPGDVLNQMGQSMEHRLLQRFQPLIQTSMTAFLGSHPEYSTAYSRPVVRTAVDAYIQDALKAGRVPDQEELAGAVSYLHSIWEDGRKNAGQASPEEGDPAKRRLSTNVGKGNTGANRKDPDAIWAEKQKLAKSNPAAYAKWAESPEGRQFINQQFFGKR